MKTLLQKLYRSEKLLALSGLLFMFTIVGVYAVDLDGTDTDGDGVSDSIDICQGTINDRPTSEIGINRHIWIGGEYFLVLVPNKSDQDKVTSEFSIMDTKGCSCSDISAQTGDGSETKFGCSQGVMSNWIRAHRK